MFRRIREKIERALERHEADRPLSRDDLDRMLHAMREELIDIRSRTAKLEQEAERVAAKAQHEIRRAELAHQKARAAEEAGDAPSANSAMEAARRALHLAEDLRDQAADARSEAERLKAESVEKLAQLKYAERNRSALLARARRVGTARKLDDLIRGPESGLKRFERAEEDIQTTEDLVEAEREIDEALGVRRPADELESDLELRRLEAAETADEVERRLSELRRQIEDEG